MDEGSGRKRGRTVDTQNNRYTEWLREVVHCPIILKMIWALCQVGTQQEEKKQSKICLNIRLTPRGNLCEM